MQLWERNKNEREKARERAKGKEMGREEGKRWKEIYRRKEKRRGIEEKGRGREEK